MDALVEHFCETFAYHRVRHDLRYCLEFLNEYLHVGIVMSISGIVLMRLSLLYSSFSTGCLQQAETIPAEPAPDNAGEGIEL